MEQRVDGVALSERSEAGLFTLVLEAGQDLNTFIRKHQWGVSVNNSRRVHSKHRVITSMHNVASGAALGNRSCCYSRQMMNNRSKDGPQWCKQFQCFIANKHIRSKNTLMDVEGN